MSITEFDTRWRQWIQTNIARGCELSELYRILLANKFCPRLVTRTLNYAPINSQITGSSNKNNTNWSPSQGEIAAALVQPKGATSIDTQGKLQLFTLDNLLSAAECRQLIHFIRPNLRPSTTTNTADQYRGYRTSRTCDLGLLQNPLTEVVDQRICHVLGIHWSYSESIQAQWYSEGQEFKSHTDYFEPDSDEYRRFARDRGQRTWTFMIYLNGDCEGGETRFTRLNRSFQPQTGQAVIWNSLDKNGLPNPDSMHCGMPVTRGEKVILTKWFRTRGAGEHFLR
ncbi:prolyl hydroxylase family protein [Microbulbifer agarilyticus]|uniref:prolyl hydroxylase family protein n=1 Tax=Microbulbifer agarilyticus TaxID=260552 RepID=UPI001CD40022|nr:2OG-Fe(II) oxygenase [Microbulbifer agarilyticus]MCA0894942.1 2OG-Fe(II) oxygenase [Microbulbifer agarilyticus]